MEYLFSGSKCNATDLLLKAGANINAVDKSNRSAFHHVAIAGDDKILDILLTHVDTNTHGVIVAESENKDDPKVTNSPQQNTSTNPLNIIEGPDKDGVRAIDMAIAHSNEAIIAKLLKRGAKLGPTTWAMAKEKPRIA